MVNIKDIIELSKNREYEAQVKIEAILDTLFIKEATDDSEFYNYEDHELLIPYTWESFGRYDAEDDEMKLSTFDSYILERSIRDYINELKLLPLVDEVTYYTEDGYFTVNYKLSRGN